MPQIGWFEILIVVVLSILIVGPKDFPIMIRKIGSWVGTFKSYFADIQNTVSEIEEPIEEDNNPEKDLQKKNKKNESPKS